MNRKRKHNRESVWLRINPESLREIYNRLMSLRAIAERASDDGLMYLIDTELRDIGYDELPHDYKASVERKRQHDVVRKCVFRIAHLYEVRKERGESVKMFTNALHPLIKLSDWLVEMERQSRKENNQ